MEENCITVDKLSKSFGQRKVIDNLSFTVKKGEVFGLLGHNGAGKSTTIDLILGLKQPDFGSAEIFGLDAASHKKAVFEKVGVQLQHTQYQQNITVEELCLEYSSLYDKICIIRNGKKVAEGSVAQVISASGKSKLEDAYLFFMEMEEL